MIPPPGAPAPLTLRQNRWLGATIVAALLPLVPALNAWAAAWGLLLVGLRLALLHDDAARAPAPPRRIPSWLLALAALAAAGTIRLAYGYLLGREPCVAFLFVLVGVKFLESRNTRDGALLVCLATFLIVTPFFYTQSLLAALAAIPALLLVGATLEVLARTSHADGPHGGWRFPLGNALRLLLYGIPLATALFVLFPRLAVPLWGLPADQGAKSGLSDSMAPGGISELSLSDTIAFRVDFDGPPPPPRQRYWRGPVLTRFDGNTWSMLPARPGAPVARADVPAISYTVTLEPQYKPWLFALDLPASLPTQDVEPTQEGSGRSVEMAMLTASQQRIARNMIVRTIRYRQASILQDHYPADAGRDAAENLNLAMRRNYANPKTLAFARELRAQHAGDAEYIDAVLRFFNREKFFYTLSPPLLDDDPVDRFLFETRRGFCEHYASAFVVLLRAAGIPARVVTGYQGGEINPRGGYMMVRQSDAHAWAEAMLDGRWQRFDPTAAVSPSRIEFGLGGALPTSDDVPMLARLDVGWFKSMQLTWDAINHDWRRRVIGFDYERQRAAWRDWNIDGFAAWQLTLMLGGFALAWGLALLGWQQWSRMRRDRARTLWVAFCARLARAGLPRLPHEGPMDYTARAARRWPDLAATLAELGETYALLRYGPAGRDGARAVALARLARAVATVPGAARLRAS